MKRPSADEEAEQLAATHTVTPVYPHGAGIGAAASEGVSGVPAPGDVVSGKYRIEECLGQGGMGMVFRATHLLSQKRVALKWMLRPTSDSQAAGRFVREARAAARIEHPNVVDVYDVGEHAGFAYLVMELLRGESLWERLGRGRLEITEAVDVVLPAMRGVAAAHAAGVIHRDLKPHNLFMCVGPDGTASQAKVLDFGISSFTDADASEPKLTLEGTILGTPTYMSPEQLHSASELDPRTDVYSMGVILYEAVTGRVPFEEPSFTSLVLAIAGAEPPSPRSLRPEVSPELEQVIVRAIARDREERFQDMASFTAALEPFGSQVQAYASGPRTAPSIAEPRRLELTPMGSTISFPPDPGPSSGSQDPVPPVAVAPRPRSSGRPGARRWPGLLAIAVIASVLGWWVARGSRPAADARLQAATPGAAAPEVLAAERAQPGVPPAASIPPSPARLGPAVEELAQDSRQLRSSPVPTPAARVVGDAADGPEPSTAVGPGRAKAGRRAARAVAGPVDGAPAQAPSPREPAGRSGTLSLDDML